MIDIEKPIYIRVERNEDIKDVEDLLKGIAYYKRQNKLLQKALKLLLKKLKMCGYVVNEKEIMKEVEI
jgi:hypothetical protein